jgi:hypothetical protein
VLLGVNNNPPARDLNQFRDLFGASYTDILPPGNWTPARTWRPRRRAPRNRYQARFDAAARGDMGLQGIGWSLNPIKWVEDAGKAGEKLVKKGVKTAKDVGDWTGDAIKDSAEWTGNAIKDSAEWTFHAGEDVVGYAWDQTGGRVVDAAEWTGDKIWQGTKWTANAFKDAGEWAFDSTMKLTEFAVDQTLRLAQFAVDQKCWAVPVAGAALGAKYGGAQGAQMGAEMGSRAMQATCENGMTAQVQMSPCSWWDIFLSWFGSYRGCFRANGEII